jgi:hypothetical protein
MGNGGELRFLARAFRATGDRRYEQAFLKGLDQSSKPSIRGRLAAIPIRPAGLSGVTSRSTMDDDPLDGFPA